MTKLTSFRFNFDRFLVLLFFGIGQVSLTHAQAVHTEVRMDANGQFRLYRNGEAYYVKGGGGSDNWDQLAQLGGNSVRTWSSDNALEVLDKAHSLGLTVMMGLWMQHERHGFDYDDSEKVKVQLDYFTKVVKEIKDHPALLLWGIGNEVDLFYTNTNVWKAINDVAVMIHEQDPHHPTCTVTAGLDQAEVQLINKDAPAIDIYGINTYGDISNVRKTLRGYGWNKGYLITEWGTTGHWEVAKTKWGAPIEPTSAEKAVFFAQRYAEDILGDAQYCMGSYAFLWGHKQETTSTWYGLFSPEGDRSESVDQLEMQWNKTPIKNHCPHLLDLKINGQNASASIIVRSDSLCLATAQVQDADGDALKGHWMIVPESTDIKSGGDAENAPEPLFGLLKKKSLQSARFRAPKAEGAYRLFYVVKDGHRHYAYGNIPFYVVPQKPGTAPQRSIAFKQQNFE
jgi:Glycosyl hydrolases family 2, TIM barrel domain